jgi:hypothetical protein
MNSPHRKTAYHIDRECSGLFQIQGSKTISVFDGADREVLPEAEIERFWAVDNNSAIYKPQYQDRATVYEIHPEGSIYRLVSRIGFKMGLRCRYHSTSTSTTVTQSRQIFTAPIIGSAASG